MSKNQFSMSASQIAQIVGTVGSPLIVVAELLKNAVDVSAKNINIYYDSEQKLIRVENDYRGFSLDEIEMLYMPGGSTKKVEGNFTNETGMYLTGSKGLGLLSVFLLCNEAEIITTPLDKSIHKIILNKHNGTVEDYAIDQEFTEQFTQITLMNVDIEIIEFLSSESEVRKLRHVCTYLYKADKLSFPKMYLHISNHEPIEINFHCDFPPMLYDVRFNFQKETGKLDFCCESPNKTINTSNIVIDKFDLDSLQEIMLRQYCIKETISTRTNDLTLSNFDEVPSFEGRVVVYERNLAGAQLKTYGAGVNVYVNDFALYNYLAEENDWLGLADYSQRKKNTRLRPHNVFGYVNFPNFDENSELLRISNERADFIQDLIFSKLMYLLKGVVMFAMFNIDVADKNPKYKDNSDEDSSDQNQSHHTSSADSTTTSTNDDEQEPTTNSSAEDETEQGSPKQEENEAGQDDREEKRSKYNGSSSEDYSPESAYQPKRNIKTNLSFTAAEGAIITDLKNKDDLFNKIYNVVFELSKLDLQMHRYSTSFLYRTLIESATIFLSRHQSKVVYNNNSLETSITSALNYFGGIPKQEKPFQAKTIAAWRDTVSKRKLIDILNQYIHNDLPVDASFLQETWNTMKGYIIACLTIL